MTAQTSHADTSRPNLTRVFLAVVGVGVLLLVVYIYLDGKWSREATEYRLAEQAKQNAELQKQLANLEEVTAELKTAKLYKEQQQAVALDESLLAIQAGRLADDRINELKQALDAWTSKSQTLSGDDGRRIASDWKLVERVHQIQKTELPTVEKPAQLSQRLNNLLKPTRDAVEQKNTSFTPSKDVMARIQELEREAVENRDAVRRTTGELVAVLIEASDKSLHPDMDLPAALAALQLRFDQERAARELELVQSARKEGADKLAQQKAENERRIAAAQADAARIVGEQTAKDIVAKAQEEQERREQKQQKKEEAAAKAAREQEFQKALPELRRMLPVFLEPGLQLRGKHPGKGPASLTVIQARGALEQTERGRQDLADLVGSSDRSTGPLPRFRGGMSPAHQQACNRVQELLIQFGPFLIEKGLLAE